MKRTIALAAAAAATVVGTTAAASAQSGSAAPAPRGPVHRVIWIGGGPSEFCTANSCGGSARSPFTFTMPGSGRYDASLTMSFRYKAVGVTRFFAGVHVGSGADVLPRRRVLAPSQPTSTTLVFRARLTGGRTYSLAPTADFSDAAQSYSIGMRQILLEIDATPDAPVTK